MLIRGKFLLVEYIEWSRKSVTEDLDSNKRSETQFLPTGWNPLKWISMHASNKKKDRDRI